MTKPEPLVAALAELAARGQTVTYGKLARALAIPGPGSIARLAQALEALMDADAAAERPLRAVLCSGRLQGGLPASGFFAKAAQLGRYAGPTQGPEAEAFVARERAALFKC
ncbi:MAG: hypothetical protein Q8P60_07040 [Pseudorhodobacter sp.]|nr:hypothetical protein [Pseudorhodobacter sp.]